jgi:hypothetical protein
MLAPGLVEVEAEEVGHKLVLEVVVGEEEVVRVDHKLVMEVGVVVVVVEREVVG